MIADWTYHDQSAVKVADLGASTPSYSSITAAASATSRWIHAVKVETAQFSVVEIFIAVGLA